MKTILLEKLEVENRATDPLLAFEVLGQEEPGLSV